MTHTDASGLSVSGLCTICSTESHIVLCADCGAPIPPARLAALPGVLYCRDCAPVNRTIAADTLDGDVVLMGERTLRQHRFHAATPGWTLRHGEDDDAVVCTHYTRTALAWAREGL